MRQLQNVIFIILSSCKYGSLGDPWNGFQRGPAIAIPQGGGKGKEVPLKDLGRNTDAGRICKRGDTVNSKVNDEADPNCHDDVRKAWLKGHPDQYLSTPQILAKYGYASETYETKTEDGYYVTLFRILGSIKSKRANNNTRLPIYLQHGLVASADTWFLQPLERTLAIKLADAGYDVWLSNSRGSTYSKKHDKYDSDLELDYWEFSFHELGLYDVTAFTRKILSVTGFSKILYLGYSLGTTQFFAHLAERPEMNAKYAAAFLMTPVAFIGHGTSPLHDIAKFMENEGSYKAVQSMVRGRINDATDMKEKLGISYADMCALGPTRCELCDNLWFFIHGYNPQQMNKSSLSLYLTKCSNAASVKMLSHYAQIATSCKFDKYNYYPTRNQRVYGRQDPPQYNMQNVKVPLHMYYSRFDKFVPLKDIEILVNSLPKGVVRKRFQVKDDYFTHMDFGIGKDADIFVYNEMIRDIQEYENTPESRIKK